MSVQAAMAFLQAIPGSPALKGALADAETHEQLARSAAEAGFACTADEIVRAFSLECGLRRAGHALVAPRSPEETRTGPSC